MGWYWYCIHVNYGQCVRSVHTIYCFVEARHPTQRRYKINHHKMFCLADVVIYHNFILFLLDRLIGIVTNNDSVVSRNINRIMRQQLLVDAVLVNALASRNGGVPVGASIGIADDTVARDATHRSSAAFAHE